MGLNVFLIQYPLTVKISTIAKRLAEGQGDWLEEKASRLRQGLQRTLDLRKQSQMASMAREEAEGCEFFEWVPSTG
jgi:hypothetical protein